MDPQRDPAVSEARDGTRSRIVAAAVDLLSRGGRDAVTTRAVAAAAGVQAPALYRLFGDKRGLLHAVAEHGYSTYGGQKEAVEPGLDPVDDLRRGWDRHVAFGLAQPAVYVLMYGDPRPGARTPAAEAAYGHLRALIRRIAAAGRLRVDEPRAADMVHAGGSGTVLTLLAQPEDRRDLGLSDAAREAVLAAIVSDFDPIEGYGPERVLRATLAGATALSEGERGLLSEWLDRLAG